MASVVIGIWKNKTNLLNIIKETPFLYKINPKNNPKNISKYPSNPPIDACESESEPIREVATIFRIKMSTNANITVNAMKEFLVNL